MYGSVNTKVDFPLYLDLYRRGRLDLDGMITRTYTLDEAPRAFEDLEKGSERTGRNRAWVRVPPGRVMRMSSSKASTPAWPG